jgi:hypothetical protein
LLTERKRTIKLRYFYHPQCKKTRTPKNAEIIIILKESCNTKGFTDKLLIAGNTKQNQTAKNRKGNVF